MELAMLDAWEEPLDPEAERGDSVEPTAAVMAGVGLEEIDEVAVVVLSLPLPWWS